MDKRVFLLDTRLARQHAVSFVAESLAGTVVTVGPPVRNGLQNALMWATLGEVSDQVKWHGQKLQPAEWKDIFTASLKRQKVVPGIDGGFVVLGSSTSRMSKAEMSELIELVYAFGAQNEVRFTDARHAESA